MNSRDMKKAMKKMGMRQDDVEAIAVIIRTRDKDIIIRNPSVQKIDMMGQSSYQVSGEEEIRKLEEEKPEIKEEDIITVSEQAKVSKEIAQKALLDNEGDLAAAIMALQEK